MYDGCVHTHIASSEPSGLESVVQNPRLEAILCRGEHPKAVGGRNVGRVAELLVHDTSECMSQNDLVGRLTHRPPAAPSPARLGIPK